MAVMGTADNAHRVRNEDIGHSEDNLARRPEATLAPEQSEMGSTCYRYYDNSENPEVLVNLETYNLFD